MVRFWPNIQECSFTRNPCPDFSCGSHTVRRTGVVLEVASIRCLSTQLLGAQRPKGRVFSRPKFASISSYIVGSGRGDWRGCQSPKCQAKMGPLIAALTLILIHKGIDEGQRREVDCHKSARN